MTATPSPELMEALEWHVDHLRSGYRNTTVAQIAQRYGGVLDPDRRLEFLRNRLNNTDLSGASLDTVLARSAEMVVALLRSPDGRAWRAALVVEKDDHRRIRTTFLARDVPPELEVRVAGPADGAALAQFELSVPVNDGGVLRFYDRGADYYAATASCYPRRVIVAQHENEVVGMVAQVDHPATLLGASLRMGYVCHMRVDRRQQGLGVGSGLNSILVEEGLEEVDSTWSMIAVENEQAAFFSGDARADQSVVLTRLDVRDVAARRRALPSISVGQRQDADELTRLLAAELAGLELCPPPDVARLVQRVEGCGPRYGWDRIAVAGSAVVGVESPVSVLVTEAGGQRVRRRQAMAFDVACLGQNAESDLVELIYYWCQRLADEGVDDLLVLADPKRPWVTRVSELGGSATTFRANIAPRVGPGPLHIDPVLF